MQPLLSARAGLSPGEGPPGVGGALTPARDAVTGGEYGLTALPGGWYRGRPAGLAGLAV